MIGLIRFAGDLIHRGWWETPYLVSSTYCVRARRKLVLRGEGGDDDVTLALLVIISAESTGKAGWAVTILYGLLRR